jgi:flavin-dependent dehydrogenase
VYPLSGEGLRYALRCGELAGKVAIDAITEGNVLKGALSEYERRWRSELEAELHTGQLLHRSLAASQDRKMDSLLELLANKPKLQRAFIDVLTGADIKTSSKVLLANEEVRRVFGHETVEKILVMFR